MSKPNRFPEVTVTATHTPVGWTAFVEVALPGRAKQTMVWPDWPAVGGLPSRQAAITNALASARHSQRAGGPWLAALRTYRPALTQPNQLLLAL